MIEESHLGHYVQSELIVFSVKYRTNTKTFQVPKDTHINEIVEFVVNEFQEFAAEPKDFRLGIFSGESLVSYISNENRYLLKNDLAVLLQAPNISSNQLKSLLACVCECLRTPSRLDEVGNLCDRLGELLRYMSCGEFALYFVDNGGIAALFELATATRWTIMVPSWSSHRASIKLEEIGG
uniref:ELMO domain-containing protein n=1 Tax=Mesocestoides corti TaxID=53468 RepID=A0A5K3F444_MESCO